MQSYQVPYHSHQRTTELEYDKKKCKAFSLKFKTKHKFSLPSINDNKKALTSQQSNDTSSKHLNVGYKKKSQALQQVQDLPEQDKQQLLQTRDNLLIEIKEKQFKLQEIKAQDRQLQRRMKELTEQLQGQLSQASRALNEQQLKQLQQLKVVNIKRRKLYAQQLRENQQQLKQTKKKLKILKSNQKKLEKKDKQKFNRCLKNTQMIQQKLKMNVQDIKHCFEKQQNSIEQNSFLPRKI